MRRASFLLAPVLGLMLTGCARDNTARSGNTGTQQSQQAQSSEPAGPRAGTAPQSAQQPQRNEPVSPAPTAPTTAGRQQTGAEARARNESRDTARQSRTLEPYGRAPRTDEAVAERGMNIPAGAVLRVRLDQALDTDKNQTGDKFTATLVDPVVVDGRVAIPKGTRFDGSITTAESSGRLSGKAVLTVKLDSFELNGRKHNITSTTATRVTDGHGKRDIGIIGGTAAAGAAIGAIAGGGKGAAIGAGAGAAAGTGAAAATGKQEVKVPAETVMVFTLQKAVDLRG